MRVTEQLIRHRNEKKRKESSAVSEEEETMTYTSWKRQKPLNQQPGGFNQGKMEGINTRKNIFDETAVFNTASDTRP
ncbi:MAG: hypothetical protein HFG66_16245 [Hungatella sp.]|jgi:hypothetical protein|nr:hypothetical protein [Hungatella sp.]